MEERTFGDVIIDILAAHAYAADNAEDAKRTAIRMGRCGSPFTYEAIEVAPDHHLVVNHIEAPLYRALIREVTVART